MAPKEEKKYSLSAEILLDFTKSIEQTGELKGGIDALGNVFETLETSVESIATNTEKMNFNIGEKFSQALRDFKSEGAIPRLNAKSLSDRFSQAITSTILNNGIDIVGTDKFVIDVPSRQWAAMTNGVKERMGEGNREADIKTSNIKPIALNSRNMRAMQERFQKALYEAIDNTLTFQWEEKNDKAKTPLVIEAESWNQLLDKVRDKFVQDMANPANIHIEGIPDFSFSSEKLKLVMNNIKNVLGSLIDNMISGDTLKELHDLPPVKGTFTAFKQAMNSTVAQIKLLEEELDGIRLNVRSPEKLEKIKERIVSLKTSVADRLEEFLESVENDIKMAPISTIDFANHKSVLENTKHIVSDFILAQLNEAVSGLQVALAIAPTGESDRSYLASLSSVQRLLLESAKEAVSRIKNANLGIDFEVVTKAYQNWASEVRNTMYNDSQTELKKLATALTFSNKEVRDSYARSVTNLMNFSFDESKVRLPGTIQVSAENILPQLKFILQQAVSKAVEGVRLEPTEIGESLRSSVEASVHQIQEKVIKAKASDTEFEYAGRIAKEAANITGIVVNRVSAVLRAISESATDMLTSEEQDALIKELRASLMTTISEINSAFSAFSLTAATTAILRSDIEKELNKLIAGSDIRFLDEDEPLVLNGAVTRAQERVREQVIKSIEAWEFESNPFSLNTATPLQAIRTTVEDMIHSASNNIMSGAGAVAEGSDAVFLNPKRRHKDVRRALATAEGYAKVSDWEKVFKAGISMEKATGQVMSEGVKSVVYRFHEAIATEVTDASTEYKDALGQVDTEPYISSAHNIVLRVGEILNDVQYRAVETLTASMNQFYKNAVRKIEKLEIPVAAIEYQIPEGGTMPTRRVPLTTASSRNSIHQEESLRPSTLRESEFPFGESGVIPSAVGRAVRPMNGDVLSNSSFPAEPMAKSRETDQSWLTSVQNVMRYITAGTIIEYPAMLAHESYDEASKFDYQRARALQNFEVKYLQPMERTKTENQQLRDIGINPEEAPKKFAPNYSELGRKVLLDSNPDMTDEELNKRLPEAVKDVTQFMTKGVTKELGKIAILNAIDPSEVANAYHIASRRYDNPFEALGFAREVSKVKSIEGDADVEDLAGGFEAISSQWGVKGSAMNKIANMMLMAANVSQARVQDLIATQQRSGTYFRENMPGMKKDDALAASIGLSSLFMQATARSGEEGGAFFKAILQKPFTRQGLQELKGMSAVKGWENLNPYDKSGKQKDFITVFSNIIDTSNQLDDKSRKDLWKELIPQWHEGSEAAILTLLTEMTHTMDLVNRAMGKTPEKNMTTQEVLTKYIETIQDADEGQAMLVRAGRTDTLQFRAGQAKSMFHSAGINVWDELKDEFGTTATYLTAFLRIIRSNAGTVANLITTAGKVLAYMGVRMAYDKVTDFVDNQGKQTLQAKMDKGGTLSMEEGRLRNLQRVVIMDEINQRLVASRTIDLRKSSLENQLTHTETERENRLEKAVSFRNEIAELQGKGAEHETTTKIEKKESAATENEKEAADLGQKTRRIKQELNQLDVAAKRTQTSLAALEAELGQNGVVIAKLTNLTKGLCLTMTEGGLDASKLQRQIEILNRDFISGTADVAKYDAEIAKLARENGVADTTVSALRREVDLLSTEFKRGTISAEQMIAKVKQLERAHLPGRPGLPGGGLGGTARGQSGSGLMENIMTASIFGASIVGGRKTVFGKIKDMVQARSLKAFTRESMKDAEGKILRDRNGKVIWARDVEKVSPVAKGAEAAKVAEAAKGAAEGAKVASKASKAMKVASVAGKIGRFVGSPLLKSLKAVPYLGEALMVTDLISMAADPIASLAMTKDEKMSINAADKKRIANTVKGIREGGLLSWVGGGLSLGWDMITKGVGGSAGGSNASVGDYWTAFKDLFSYDYRGEELDKKLKEDLKYEETDRDARILAQAEEAKKAELLKKYDPMDTNRDGLFDPTTDKSNQQLSYEQTDDMITRINNKLSVQTSQSDRDVFVDKTRLLIQGVREDSQQMRDLMKEYLTKNMQYLQESIVELRKRRDAMAPGDARDKVDADLADKEKQLAQDQLDLGSVQNTAVAEVKKDLANSLDLVDFAYDKRYYGLLSANGGEENTPEARRLQSAKLNEMNSTLEDYKAKFQSLLSSGDYIGEDYLDIWKQIQSIEVTQAKNRVEINKKLTQSKSTFNVPSGLKVIDAYEYLTKKNIQKSILAGAGGATINVRIDNMSGDTKDIEKMTSALEKTFRESHVSLVTQFANDVKSGVGANYRS